VGFPAHTEAPYLASCLVPKFFISSTRDQYAPRPVMEAVYRAIAGPKQLIWIEAQDHFFEGALDSLEEAVYGLT